MFYLSVMKFLPNSTPKDSPNIGMDIQIGTALDIKNYLPHGSPEKYIRCVPGGYRLLKGLVCRLSRYLSDFFSR